MEVTPARLAVDEIAPDLLPGITRPRRAGIDSALRRLLAAGDAAAVLFALIVALAISGRPDRPQRLLWGLVAVPLMVVMFKLYGLYDRDVKRISYSTVDDVPWLLHASILGTLALWFYSRNTPMQRMDFVEVVVFGGDVVVLGAVARFLMRQAAGRLIGRERGVLIGDGPLSRALLMKLAAHPEYRLDVIGSLSFADEPSAEGLPILGSVAQLASLVDGHGVNRVLLSSSTIDEHELEELLRRCRALSLKVSMLPKLSDVLGSAVEIDDVEGITVLGVNPPWLPRSSRALKRAMDILIAAPLLIVLTPILVLLAIAIKLDSPGPVLFAQERVGRGSRRFRVMKLRTMVVDAERRRAELLAQSTDPGWLKLEHDPRITRIGSWIRRLSLDELPQLWNVLRGEMSMVGPRPLIPAEDDRVLGWGRGRLDLTPGITGYWQVLGRTRIPFDEMVKLDYLYVMNWSLWEDVRLMLRTLPAVIGGRGAN